MAFKAFKRSSVEYNISRTSKYCFQQRQNNYIEYNIRDEMYMRCKETARCYQCLGNIPMMLNRLYTSIRYEEKGFKYNIKKQTLIK